jgi:hypothetical protein
MSNKTHTVFMKLRITPAMAACLDTMKQRGEFGSRTQLVRSLLLAIINDDAKAHGEPPLDEAACPRARPTTATRSTASEPELAVEAPAKHEAPAAPLDGACTFDPARRVVRTGHAAILLTRRQAEVFTVLARGRPHDLITGYTLAHLMATHPANISNLMYAVRAKLRPLRIDILGHKGRQGGYRLVHGATGDPVKVTILNANGRHPS